MANYPIPFDSYQEQTFHKYYFTIYQFGWLDSSFHNYYYFMDTDLVPIGTGDKKGRIKLIKASDQGTIIFSETYHIELFPEEQKIYVNFLNERFKVFSVRVHEGNVAAARLELLDASNNSHVFYGTRGNPFNPAYKEIYTGKR